MKAQVNAYVDPGLIRMFCFVVNEAWDNTVLQTKFFNHLTLQETSSQETPFPFQHLVQGEMWIWRTWRCEPTTTEGSMLMDSWSDCLAILPPTSLNLPTEHWQVKRLDVNSFRQSLTTFVVLTTDEKCRTFDTKHRQSSFTRIQPSQSKTSKGLV